VRNFGNLLVEMSMTAPDGVICFFTNHAQLEHILVQWNDMKILNKVMDNKLIFVETEDDRESMLALSNYKKACDNGRGGILFALANGKVAAGVSLKGHYSRCVIMFGVPYEPTLSRNLKARIAYLNQKN